MIARAGGPDGTVHLFATGRVRNPFHIRVRGLGSGEPRSGAEPGLGASFRSRVPCSRIRRISWSNIGGAAPELKDRACNSRDICQIGAVSRSFATGSTALDCVTASGCHVRRRSEAGLRNGSAPAWPWLAGGPARICAASTHSVRPGLSAIARALFAGSRIARIHDRSMEKVGRCHHRRFAHPFEPPAFPLRPEKSEDPRTSRTLEAKSSSIASRRSPFMTTSWDRSAVVLIDCFVPRLSADS